jgi:hypothetical protein
LFCRYVDGEPDRLVELNILVHKIFVDGTIVVVDDDVGHGSLHMEDLLQHVLSNVSTFWHIAKKKTTYDRLRDTLGTIESRMGYNHSTRANENLLIVRSATSEEGAELPVALRVLLCLTVAGRDCNLLDLLRCDFRFKCVVRVRDIRALETSTKLE